MSSRQRKKNRNNFKDSKYYSEDGGCYISDEKEIFAVHIQHGKSYLDHSFFYWQKVPSTPVNLQLKVLFPLPDVFYIRNFFEQRKIM